jgi:hypothetical protein
MGLRVFGGMRADSWASFHLNVAFDELDDQSGNPCLESVPIRSAATADAVIRASLSELD